MTMLSLSDRLSRGAAALAALTSLLLISGCERPDYESPIVNQDGPVIDIAQLPDIDQTTTELIDLIERVQQEVARLVPASEPWEWTRDQLVAEAGLTDVAAPQNQSGNHDVRFSSDDGRTLMFGSRVASLITGKIACRRAAP